MATVVAGIAGGNGELGTSRRGVKILTTRAPEDSGGITNVDSLKFIEVVLDIRKLCRAAAREPISKRKVRGDSRILKA